MLLACPLCKFVLSSPSMHFRSKPSKKRVFRMPWVAPQSTQAEVYERAKSVVETFLALRDRDCALLAYGATGSGKTFTMQGPKRAYSEAAAGASPNTVDNTEGVLQRCLRHIFTVCAYPTVLTKRSCMPAHLTLYPDTQHRTAPCHAAPD